MAKEEEIVGVELHAYMQSLLSVAASLKSVLFLYSQTRVQSKTKITKAIYLPMFPPARNIETHTPENPFFGRCACFTDTSVYLEEEFDEGVPVSYNKRDLLLYACGIGCNGPVTCMHVQRTSFCYVVSVVVVCDCRCFPSTFGMPTV